MKNNPDYPFCGIERPIIENDTAKAIFDKYPINKGHMLIIPKRHLADYFQADSQEKEAL